MTRTRWPAAANAVARLIAVVVLPTPPFWLATAMIRARRAAEAPAAVPHRRQAHADNGTTDADAESPRRGSAMLW